MDLINKLRKETKELHDSAESHRFNATLLSGRMEPETYKELLKRQYIIFNSIENNPSCPSFIKELKMSERVMNDLDESLESVILDDISVMYSRYLSNVRADVLLPHVYLNYLQLLYGGQMIKKVTPIDSKMFDIENTSEIIRGIRNLQQEYLSSVYELWLDEVNFSYQTWIAIYDELSR